MDSSLASEDASLSIRNSCNRCRTHKLKCTTDSSSKVKACKRCARAMVDCVFSRRKKPRRCARDEPDATDTRSASSLAAHLPTPAGSSASIPTDWPPSPPSPAEDTITWRSEAVLATPVADQDEDDFGIWAQPFSALVGGPLGNAHQPATAVDEAFTLVAKYIEDSTVPEGMQSSVDMEIHTDTREQNQTYHESPNSLGMVGTERLAAVVVVSESGSTGSASLRLASDLHERLETLRHGPWAGDGCESFDGYPVGSVLHLSQEFVRLATATPGGIGAGHLQAQTLFGPACFAHHPNASSSSSLHQDVPATLVLTACGVMLAQLFDVVLGHLHSYLQHHHRNIQTTTPEGEGLCTDPTVCLGDLPPLNERHSRTHTAIRMLLASLDKAEKALGLPPEAPLFGGFLDHPLAFGNNARWGQQIIGGTLSAPTSTSSLQDAFAALRTRAAEAKDLLRTMLDM